MVNPEIVEEFSSCYISCLPIGLFNSGIIDDDHYDFDVLTHDSLTAMVFLSQYAHERAGANRNYPRFHRAAILQALDGRDFEETVLNDEEFPDQLWDEFCAMTADPITGEEHPNENMTSGAVREIYHYLNNPPANIITHLGNMNLIEASGFLNQDQLHGIGEKISALFLRDLQYLFNSWTPTEDTYYLLQPMDRWVKRIAFLCWPDEYTPTNNHNPDARIVSDLCLQNDINPLFFNMGAWFIGSHYSQLCRFHHIPDNMSIDVENCIEQFEVDQMNDALTQYFHDFINGESMVF